MAVMAACAICDASIMTPSKLTPAQLPLSDPVGKLKRVAAGETAIVGITKEAERIVTTHEGGMCAMGSLILILRGKLNNGR